MSKPASQKLSAAKTRFDELQAVHQIETSWTHWVGAFLPFHRLFLFAHETLLRDDCGYKGHQPYWHEPKDAGNFLYSDLLDPETGFGGNGSGSKDCITNGPFKNYVNSLGPFFNNTKHCINRNVNETESSLSAQKFVDECMSRPDFASAWPCIEANPHRGGHAGVGGLMLDPVSSPGDPLFYLHHTWLDKLWWNWQSIDLKHRLTDISGTNIIPPEFLAIFPPEPPEFPRPPYPVPGDPGNVTTLNHVLDLKNVIPNRIIAEVMDIRAKPLCYTYVEPS